MERLRALAVGGLVALGLLSVAGALAGAGALSDLGRRLVASPLPLVFGRQGGLELTARRFELRLELTDGSTRTERGTPQLGARLRGPFARVAPLLGALTYFPVVPEPQRTALLRFALCDDGPLARDLALPAHVRSATVEGWSARTGGGEEAVLRIECGG